MAAPAEIIVEPEILAQSICDATKPRDKNMIVVDLRSEAAYNADHVPGAIHLPPQTLMLGQPPVPGKLPEMAQLKRVFGYLGHTPESHYIVYDDEGGGWAGRFIWTLDVLGHSRYSYINGGIHAWNAAELPLETTPNQAQATEPELTINPASIANINDILPRLNDPQFVVWDARSGAEYRGEKMTANKTGHIPGAIHCEWTELMDPIRHYRIRRDAENHLRKKGFNAEQEIVTHCQSHHRSGFTYLVGKSLGFNIRGYHGSWAEWGNHPDTPVEK